MAKYVCTLCGYVYDEDKGIPESGIAPGTRFEDLPDDWTCPMCGSPKSMFKKIEEAPAPSEPVSAGPVKDAVSIPAGEGGDRMREMSFAEMPLEQKNVLCHRGIATAMLMSLPGRIQVMDQTDSSFALNHDTSAVVGYGSVVMRRN